MKKITYYSNIENITNGQYVDIHHILDLIKNGNSKTLVEAIRSEPIEEKRKLLKAQLPCICFSGVFRKREDKGLVEHSGYIILDWDHLPNVEVFKSELKQDPFIFAAFISPSGDGVKALVKIPPQIDNHRLYYRAILQSYNGLDKKNCNESRVCYESYDPDIYINIASEIWDSAPLENSFDIEEKKPLDKIVDTSEIFDFCVKILEKRKCFISGNRNNYIYSLASLFNIYGISQLEAINLSLKYTSDTFTYKEIESTVKSAYKNKSDHNTRFFESSKVFNFVRSSIRLGRERNVIINHLVEVENMDRDSAVKLIDSEKNKMFNQKLTFWNVNFNEKGTSAKIEFIYYKFTKWLSSQGFFQYRVNVNVSIYLHIVDNILTEITEKDIKNYTLKWVLNISDETFDGIDKLELYQYLMKNCSTFFSSNVLETLENVELNINTDTIDCAFFYFLNGIVKVQKNEIKLLNYSDISGYVWNDRIIKRHITIAEYDTNNDYCRFLENISHSDDHLKQIISAIGYLLTTYKDRSCSKAIVLIDEVINDNANGGTGKGLLIEGLKKMRKTVSFDGKTFSFDKNFCYQQVDVDTELLFFDDVQKGFNFERLFSVITEGISVEKKNLGEFKIPFEKSPKIVVSTNYIIKGEGSSHERRKFVIELKNYYNQYHTPLHEFKRLLFEQWELKDWNDYFNFTFFCYQFYLKNGLVEFVSDNSDYKNLIAATSEEFVEFADNITEKVEHNKQMLHDTYIRTYRLKIPPKLNTFTRYLQRYAKYKRYEFYQRRSGNDYYIAFNYDITDRREYDF